MFSKIDRLKRKARFHYMEYIRIRDDLDCGAHMAEHFNPRISGSRTEFNRIMDELAKIDPETPTTRL